MSRDGESLEKRIMKKLDVLAPQIRNQNICKLEIDHKIVYLTIDDAPTRDSRLKFEILQQKRIPSIWFCIGKEIEKYRDVVVMIIKSGGIIGNHSYSHIDFSATSLEKCFWEIGETDKLIDECYKLANVPRKVKLFRFPYGIRGRAFSINGVKSDIDEIQHAKAIQDYLEKLGYRCPIIPGITYEHYKKVIGDNSHDMYWTYDVMEWALTEKEHPGGISCIEDVIQLMDVDMPEKWLGLNCSNSEEIILIHDHLATSKYFEEIIDHLMKKGMIFSKL